MMETKMENGKIQLLDCTLRDGGQGLEAAYRTEGSKTVFTEQMINDIVDHLSRTDIEIVELGYIEKSHFANHPFANHFSVEEVSKFIPKTPNKKQMYIALFTGPDMDEGQIPEWNPSLIEGVRVILRYSELEKSLDYCEMLARKGYKTFVQPMLTMRYTKEELKMVIDRANKMGAYALYFVDSFGYMQTTDVERLFSFIDKYLSPEIRIGFHAHNNMELAFSNVQHFLKIHGDRNIIIDSCAIGMGQGAGNMQTELILPHLNTKYEKKYCYDELLEVCDHVLKRLPDDLKHRYTKENLQEVLDLLKR